MSNKLPIEILGTNHISAESVKDIETAHERFNPDIIAVELDKGRLNQLLNPPKENKGIDLRLIKQLGVRGFIFAVIARYIQQRLGKKVGIKPGSEMLAAVKLARKENKLLSLIDRPIDKTIRKLMKELTWKEKRRFLYDFLFAKYDKKARAAQTVELDITKVPASELIDTLIGQVKDRYPTIHRVLIDERNHFMAKRLIVMHKRDPKKRILAVVGAGHKKEMEELLHHYFLKLDIVKTPKNQKIAKKISA